MAFSFMFLFLKIQIVGVIAMATSQATVSSGLERISRSLTLRVITITVRLKQQNVTNPVLKETDSLKIFHLL